MAMLAGKVLGNRYELMEKIGQGGMAIVYKAKDKLLNRFVAVKVLRQEFIHDDQFIKKFRRESQAAASLSHPNIVNIYDVGVQEDIHYIVMELIKGITLKEFIKKNRPIQWEKALHIILQISSALEHAHKNHIIHRDIKPHNIIITEDGIAKVADFGIARAITSSTITQVEDTMGSVHYFSPEQARGGFVNEKSDLYSLGIVLYEMVTGEVPFNGETSVSVALKHLQGEIQPPITINKSLPPALNSIILKLLKKNPDERYMNATALMKDLDQVLRKPNENFTEYNFDEDAPTQITPVLQPDDNKGDNKGNNPPLKSKKKKREKWVLILSLAIFFIIASILGAVAFSLGNYFMVKEVEVPNVEGKNIDDAMKILMEANLKPEIVEREYHKDIEEDQVISQDPKSGEVLKENQPVKLIVSAGAKYISVPDVTGKYEVEAISQLENTGFEVGEVIYEFNEEFDKGIVFNQDPKENVEIKEGSKIDLYVSKGTETVIVPSLVGKHLEDAKEALSSKGLSIGEIQYKDSEKYAKDHVMEQSPSANEEVSKETPINLVLSKGKTSTKMIEVDLNQYQQENDSEDTVTVVVELLDYQDNTSTVAYQKKHSLEEGLLQISIKGTGFQIYTVKINNKKFAEGFISF